MTTLEERRSRASFERVRLAGERRYASTLMAIAKTVGKIVRDMNPQDEEGVLELRRVLDRYAHAAEPWARKVALNILLDIDKRDAKAWNTHAESMGQDLRRELAETPTGEMLRALLARQVELITSIPIEAGQRVHRLVLQNMSGGQRSASLVDEIQRTGEVTRSRAVMIARTETARAATGLTQVRAQQIGSESYEWLSAHDAQVRPDHKRLDGHTFFWNDPPIADTHTKARYHAGAGINCRCVPLPHIPRS